MPLFIQYTVKGGVYRTLWADLTLSKDEFEKLKANCPQLVFWEEIQDD
jgi:hypothetical protein